MNKHVLIVAGDPSADQHAAALIQALRKRYPELRVSALGGLHLRQAADVFLFDLVSVGGFGFWEPVKKLPQLWNARRVLKAFLRKDRPDVVIPVDYYGFNIHTARLAHRLGIPVAYYISPQVWASRPHRVRRLAGVLDKMLVIFPFEVPLYQQAGIPVSFVGHPLLDRVPAAVSSNGTLSIGLLPGSRRAVVERHLPLFVQTAQALKQIFPEAHFYLFQPQELDEGFYRPFLAAAPWIHLTVDAAYEKRKTLSLAISVSGTAALENTLLGIPMIIMYKLPPLTYQIARRLIRIPFVGIPNILAGKSVVPELLQDQATPETLTAAARALLTDPAALQGMRQTLLALRAQLGNGRSSERAAEEIGHLLEARA